MIQVNNVLDNNNEFQNYKWVSSSTKFLTFADEAQAREILAEYINEDGEWITGGLYWSMLVLGVVYPEATEENPNPAPYAGYGVNWAGDMPEYLLPFEVEVKTPANVFA